MFEKIASNLLVGTTALLVTAASQAALADGSCTTLLASKAQEAKANGRWYTTQLTMHRENTKFVSYSEGFLAPNADGSFSGRSNQLFSDRVATSAQPFNIGQADQLDPVRLSSAGLLDIHYNPDNFNTSWDLSCKGSVFFTYIPNFGVVTLTFRDLFTPIP
jgi:hypothetical protein